MSSLAFAPLQNHRGGKGQECECEEKEARETVLRE